MSWSFRWDEKFSKNSWNLVFNKFADESSLLFWKCIKTLKKSDLQYKIKPLFDTLKGNLAILANVDKEKENKAIKERLIKIEARIEKEQVELKSISNKILALLKVITQKQ